jgi:hypothetical protein
MIVCHVGDQEFLELHEGLKTTLEIKEVSDTDLRKFVLVVDPPPKKPVITKFDRALQPFLREPSGPATLTDSEEPQ